jgi:hypothetical protein
MVSSVSKGWMANIADHSPFARRFVCSRRSSFVVASVVGLSVLCGVRSLVGGLISGKQKGRRVAPTALRTIPG